MSSGSAGRRGIARLVAVCALLFGLFLMHGAPTTAAEGCHGAMPFTTAPVLNGHAASAMAPAAMPDSAPDTPAVQAADGAPDASALRATADAGAHGELCLSTPAQGRDPLPAPALLAVAAAPVAGWSPAAWRAATGRARRRGPPAGGRDLLTRVCIART